jgi:hypothetical protein
MQNVSGDSNLMDKSYSRRLQLNSAIVKNLYWVLPVDDVGHENYMPVGRGVQSSPSCGKWAGINTCDNVEGHEGGSVDGRDATGMVVVRHRHMWCKRSLCPICFIRGWSVRRAGNIASRLEEGINRGFGEIEHILVSVPVSDYGLEEDVLRKKCRNALFDRGVLGGCMQFHGYRRDKKRGVLVWSPHYHTLGFIKGGFDRCRECSHSREDCASCDGFKGREVRGYAKDGHLVKVFDERKTVFGTGFYQAHHSTVRLGIRRFHAVTWFGVCGNRKYASPKIEAKVTCPVCGDEMKRSVYVGFHPFIKEVGHPDYEAISLRPKFDENGEPNFIDKG